MIVDKQAGSFHVQRSGAVNINKREKQVTALRPNKYTCALEENSSRAGDATVSPRP